MIAYYKCKMHGLAEKEYYKFSAHAASFAILISICTNDAIEIMFPATDTECMYFYDDYEAYNLDMIEGGQK